jgi:site-specific DNA-cytosine methylase
MRFISLFSGIGGFDLGFERTGMECVAQVEITY